MTVSLLAPGWVLTERIKALLEAHPELASKITPYAQSPAAVAERAFDGLLDGQYIIATNPVSRAFAMDQAYDFMAEIQRLPVVPDANLHVHDGAGDAAMCPWPGAQS